VGVLKDAGWWVTEGQRCVIDDPATVAVGVRACDGVCVRVWRCMWVWVCGWGSVCVGAWV